MLYLRAIALACACLATAVVVAHESAPSARTEPGVGRYRDFGDALGFRNILPPGSDGSLNGAEAILAQAGTYPPHTRDQLTMYENLVYNTPGLTDERIGEFFKDASFGVREDDIDRVYSPTTGVTVVRDLSFGVPHIYGETRYATMFAQGYTAAEDRLFLMDALRHVGRARVSEFLGASPANMALDRDQLAIAPYTEADLTAQIAATTNSGPEGQAINADASAYVDGVNAYINEALLDPTKLPAEYPALQQIPRPWKLEDAVAIASLVGGIFGKGGGGELNNACAISRIAAETGDGADARAIFDDFKFANDPEAPTTTTRPAPYMTDLGTPDPAAHPAIDCASLQPIDGGTPSLSDLLNAISGVSPRQVVIDAPWGQIPLDFNTAMSNALLVGGSETAAGHPIAVFGPQTAYFMPQLLVEKDVHGPGIDARGASFAGTDLYVQLGRGRDYAWSATSASADNVDQWVLQLCEPLGVLPPTVNSMGYMHDGVCEPIETYQHVQIAKPSVGGPPGGPDIILSWRVDRTQEYGPLVARGTLNDGTPIAIATLRTTYRSELRSALGFYRVNDPNYMAGGYSSFQTAMGDGVDYTFNWFFIDDENIGYQHSCRCPQRAQGVDPYLPVWGTGEWDWQGFIPRSAQPWDLNPSKGFITSWNNKQAPQFKSNDSNFSYGPVYRSQLLDARIEERIAAGPIDRVSLIDAMEDAGTVDLRGEQDLALLLDAMGPTAPGGSDARLQDMRNRLAAWLAAETHRRDRDLDGVYDDPQPPAIMDAWWPRLLHAMFDDESGNAVDNLGTLTHDAPQLHLGSAFNNGFYSQVNKDLRRVLGMPQQAPLSRPYCGGGDVVQCRAALWSSLAQAAADLETEFASPNVADWRRAIVDDDVRHSAVGVTPVQAIHWINRPTFQQVVQICGVVDSDCDDVVLTVDNCAEIANPAQENGDRNLLLFPHPQFAYDDTSVANSDSIGDACDPDDDNDGRSDADELAGSGCAATDPRDSDSDGDNYLDGAECALATDPMGIVSRPTTSQCGPATDADADGLLAFREVCFYNTDPANANTDGDACSDGREVASINSSDSVDVLDLQQIAVHGGAYARPGSVVQVDFDVTKNGAVDVLDLQQVAARSGACP